MTTTTPPTRRRTKPAARAVTAAEPARADWRAQAACRAADSELFFPTGNSTQARLAEEAAKRVCSHCPVRQTCLEWALDTDQYTGVWGGLSEKERRTLARGGERSFDRCLENQEFIEERLAAKGIQRDVAAELGVSYHVLRRALAYFAQERQQGLGVAA
ncbi:WhiB family transcriptional regulator [Streptomyces bluensis]|uniref:Transcriptional regulator WhiB n=1 Tax=Streptomyces bluensis TaxID=33897 RepID=A0ABW6UTY8_9ACTN